MVLSRLQSEVGEKVMNGTGFAGHRCEFYAVCFALLTVWENRRRPKHDHRQTPPSLVLFPRISIHPEKKFLPGLATYRRTDVQ